jgi:hypothetical protein
MNDKQLVKVNDKEMTVKEVFTTETMDTIIDRLEKEAAQFVGDVSSKAGRKEIAAFSRKFSTTKSTIDKAGLEYARELKSLPKKIDAERKRLKDACDRLRDQTRSPLTEYENIRKRIDESIGRLMQKVRMHEEGSECIAVDIETILSINTDKIVEDKREQYISAVDQALSAQFGFLFAAIQDENDREELDRLRKEKEAREAEEKRQADIKAAEARAKKEAEEKAETERLRAIASKEKAEREAERAREDAERAKKEEKERADREIAAAKREAEEKENARVKAEARAKKEAEDEKKKREADEELRDKTIINIARSLAATGITAGQARKIAVMLINNEVPHTTVTI